MFATTREDRSASSLRVNHAEAFPDLGLVKIGGSHFLIADRIGDGGLLELPEHGLRRSLEGGRVLIPPIRPYPFNDPVFIRDRFRALEVGDAAVYTPDPELVHALAVAEGIEAGHDVLRVLLPLVACHIVPPPDVHFRPAGGVQAL